MVYLEDIKWNEFLNENNMINYSHKHMNLQNVKLVSTDYTRTYTREINFKNIPNLLVKRWKYIDHW
jgi:hypothetical protein